MPTPKRLPGDTMRIAVPLLKTGNDAELLGALGTHAGLILRSAARILGSMDEAQDVAQDLAEKLLRAPPKDVRSWPALLKTMAVNCAIDRYRRRREITEPVDMVTEDGPESVLQAAEKARALRRALGRLSERDAQLFSFYYFADLSHADIGRQMDMSANSVGVALHRIRQRLSAFLQPHSGSTQTGENPS